MSSEAKYICGDFVECKRDSGHLCRHDHPHARQTECNSRCLVQGTNKESACCVILGIVIVRHEERLDE